MPRLTPRRATCCTTMVEVLAVAAGGGRTVWASTAEGGARLDGDEWTVLPSRSGWSRTEALAGGERVAIDARAVDEDSTL